MALDSRFNQRPAFAAANLALFALIASSSLNAQQNHDGLVPVDVANTNHQLMAPPGTTISKVADLAVPRLISLGRDGEMFIGSQAGRVYRLSPPYEQGEILVRFDDYPHSVSQRGEKLYVATTDALLAADYRPGDKPGENDFARVVRIPGGGGHSSRTLVTGPDERLYVALGIQGNCSNQYIGDDYRFENQRGGIMVLDERGDSPQWQPYATGLRNPVGLAFDHQGTLYATNNGPDHWGYEEPREVLVRAEQGNFFGMPWFQWIEGEYRRDDCINGESPRPVEDISNFVATFPARSAPMDLSFVPQGSSLGLDAVVAVRGSWATKPDGGASGDPATRREPLIAGIALDSSGNGQIHELLTGFQDEQGNRWARPVGIAFTDSSTFYFTSDSGETGLYRVSFANDNLAMGNLLSKPDD
ncbi:PQQ-dependent sugar dehydrogenase [Halomonas sp. M20]|uniref:PQQ-dependent sugar dehydrogenase n=1 Tax=Halomonas sp. M20 TaxID=2763264 RepID=UPI001D0A051F|nr:PQQ-dependent sugar dehydrogenase [Halomonas sp. M20]